MTTKAVPPAVPPALPRILAIESSCDDTSVAVIEGPRVLSNRVADQTVHAQYGGVVPELASRAHAQHIVPVVDAALREAGLAPSQLDAVAFTQGPGLLGSLLVGSSFAQAWAWAHGLPAIPVHHMHAHVLAHFLGDAPPPALPFLCLTVSGGHTQIIRVDSPNRMVQLGTTLDDAAGEAFDKLAKLLGLPYPGGPLVDRLAQAGDPRAFPFTRPQVPGLDMSFSGLKTQVLHFLQRRLAQDAGFLERHRADVCASVQHTILDILLDKLDRAVTSTGIRTVAIAGGVSANSGLRARLQARTEEGWQVHIPPMSYCTDNAAMIAIAGALKWADGYTPVLSVPPDPRLPF